jgi:hypothetical protein
MGYTFLLLSETTKFAADCSFRVRLGRARNLEKAWLRLATLHGKF